MDDEKEEIDGAVAVADRPLEGQRQASFQTLNASSRLAAAARKKKRTLQHALSGFEEPFRLHAPSFHIPEHLWHPTNTRWLEPHDKKEAGGDGGGGFADSERLRSVRATWGQACGRLSGAIHWPYLPWWGRLQHHKESAVADTLAGLTAGVMLIPQGMAYAMIASLPPIIGLYTGSIAPFIFALLGTSQQLSVGPVSLASIYFPTTLANLGILYSTAYTSKAESDHARTLVASLVTFFVGAIFLLMGTFKLGSLIRYLSHSVMTGFTTAAGAYVGFSQIKYILDIHLHHHPYHYQEYVWVITHLHEANPKTVTLGLVAFLVMFSVKVLKRRYPSTPARRRLLWYRLWRLLATFNTLIVVVVSAVVASRLDIPIVGKVEPGLSHVAVPALHAFPLNSVVLESIPVALLAYMEAYAVGRKYAELNHYEIDSNQDLFGLGVSNLVSSFFGTYVASGSFARTALNAEAGAKTPFSNLVLGSFMLLTLTCLSSYLYYIPMAVLGAVIENAIINLIDIPEFIRAFRIAPLSFVVMLVTFLSTFLISIQDGLLIGLVSSVVLVIYQLSTVDTVPLGIDGDVVGLRFVSMAEYSHALPPLSRVKVVRPVASLFFGNASAFRAAFLALIREGGSGDGSCQRREKVMVPSDGGSDEDEEMVEEGKMMMMEEGHVANGRGGGGGGGGGRHHRQNGGGGMQYVLVDCCAIKVLDLTAMGALAEVVSESHHPGGGGSRVAVLFSNSSHDLKASLQACHLLEGLGGDLVTRSTEEVYATITEWISQEQMEDGGDGDGGRSGSGKDGAPLMMIGRQTSHHSLFRSHSSGSIVSPDGGGGDGGDDGGDCGSTSRTPKTAAASPERPFT